MNFPSESAGDPLAIQGAPNDPAPIVAVILHFRNAGITGDCLDTWADEGISAAVVVDNSEDGGGSLALLRARIARVEAAGVATVVVEPGRNLGFSAGVNLGVRSARQRFGEVDLLVVNNDARPQPGALGRLRHTLRTSAGASVVAPLIRLPDGKMLRGAWYQRWFGLYLDRPMAGATRYLSGCCIAVPQRLCAEALFDETYFFYGEDVELSARLARSGVRLQIEEMAVVEHAATTSSRNGSLFYEYHMNRAHMLLAARLGSTPLGRMAAIAGRLLTLPLRAAVRCVRFRSMNAWRGLGMALRDVLAGRVRSLTPSI